jgi:hypothetical protein
MRGAAVPDGTRRVAPNGYHYIKVNGSWRLYHHVVAEKNLGRSLKPDEGVYFKDKDRENFHPNNIVVRVKKGTSKAARRARLEAKIAELQAELNSLNEEL